MLRTLNLNFNFNEEDYRLTEKWIQGEFQTALLKIYRQAMSSLELEELLTQLIHHAHQLFAVDLVWFALTKPKHSAKPSYLRLGVEPHFDCLPTYYFSEKSLLAKAVYSNMVVTSSDYWNDPSFEHDADLDTLLHSALITSVMLVPLLINNETVALLGMGKTTVGSWTDIEVEWAAQIAVVAAPAIHNARLQQQLKIVNAELTMRNQELLLQKEHEQVSAVLALARTAVHDLSQPLTVIQAELEFALQYNEPLELESLRRMQAAVNDITSHVREYQKIMRFVTVEAVEGITIIDRQRATQKLHPRTLNSEKSQFAS